MKQYCLKISSKNEKSLKNFIIFFFKDLRSKFNIIQKSGQIDNNKQVITILKSPHVNKTSQEQFETRIFLKRIQIKTFLLNKNLIFIKKILTNLFQDISVSLELISSSESNNQNRLFVFYPDNFKLIKIETSKKNIKRSKQKLILKNFNLEKNLFIQLSECLHTISIFGEIAILFSSKFSTKSLNSSAVEQRTENPCVGSSNLSSDKN